MDQSERDRLRALCEKRKARLYLREYESELLDDALPAALDALDALDAKEARLVEHLSRTQQACAIFERNSADVAEMWERVKKAEAERDALRAKLDAAEARIAELQVSPRSHNGCEGCWSSGRDVTKIHVTNGVLRLCKTCLDDVNRKNPQLATIRRAT